MESYGKMSDATQFLEEGTIYFAIDPDSLRSEFMYQWNPSENEEIPYIGQQIVAQAFGLDDELYEVEP